MMLIDDEQAKKVIQYVVYYPPPVSLDALIELTGIPAVVILRVIEGLRELKVITEKPTHGKGFYFVNNKAFIDSEREKFSGEDRNNVLHKIIRLYSVVAEDGQEKLLALAELYAFLEDDVREGYKYIQKAAAILMALGNKEQAAHYYNFLFKTLTTVRLAKNETGPFIDTILGKIALSGHLMPIQEQIVLLRKACSVATRKGLQELAAKVHLNLGEVLKGAGEYSQASKHLKMTLELAKKIGDEKLLKDASLSLCDVFSWKGRVEEAVRYYEKAIGEVEDFGDDESTLKGTARVGRCYVMCGHVARGIGLIDAVHARAETLSLEDTIIFANLMKALSFLEIRNIEGVETSLAKIFCYPDDVLGHYVLWAACSCKAYTLINKGEYETAFEYIHKGIEHSKTYGFAHQKGPWNFEMANMVDLKQSPEFEEWRDSEIRRLLNWDDIYMRGVALRYRAFEDIRIGENENRILSDLRMSERYLKEAGARVELARTHLVLGEYYINQDRKRIGQAYLQRAWELFSKVNKRLFPEALMGFLPQSRKIEIMMERIINISETLGSIHERSPFLDKMINLAMDTTMATRGGFFITNQNHEVIPVASRNLDAHSLGEKYLGEVKTRILQAIQNSEEGMSEDSGQPSQIGTGFFMCVPVQMGKLLYGYLYLDNRLNSGLFTSQDLLYTRFLAKQIAIGLANHDSHEEIRALKERFKDEALSYKKELGITNPSKGIIGCSEAMQKVLRQVEQVAITDTTVLITGETGVGKSLIAKAIHSGSLRRDAPFIQLNLAAIPQELVPSELFGYEKGAFTGAVERYKGRFELAHSGTIFLDEIGDLSNDVQIKLLGVLQDRVFERLGSGKQIISQFRVIVATNRDLNQKVEAGQFRQDLYYRLKVFPIHIPPLRDRKEDIPLLAVHFLEVFASKMGKNVKHIHEKELQRLLLYEWPGNVRELEHYIERAVVLTDRNSRILRLPDISSSLHRATTKLQPLPLAMVEKEHIEKTLLATGWKVSGPGGAASVLHLNPKTLFSRMKKLGISKPHHRVSDNPG